MDISSVKKIVIHCSATAPSQDIGAREINEWHTSPPNNWSMIGYHFVIRRDGTLEYGRPLTKQGAHTRGHNRQSWGICLVGGVDANGDPDDNYTVEQYRTLRTVVMMLKALRPTAEVLGHRDLSPDLDGDGVIEEHEWLKYCPCVDIREWWMAVA